MYTIKVAVHRVLTQSADNPEPQGMKISEEVLCLSVIIFTVICLTLLAVIRMFIYSKPAGRRMVSTDIVEEYVKIIDII